MKRWDEKLTLALRRGSGSDDVTPNPVSEALRNLEETMESIKRRLSQLEKCVERQRVAINEVRTNTSPFDDLLTKTNGDIQSIQQQLEYVVISLERERGIVTDHTEQLRLFVRESTRRDGGRSGLSDSDPSFLFLLATWLYRPVVDFANGCYVLLSPLIGTLQSLSLFNPDVQVRQTESGVYLNNAQPSEDLLSRLQKGQLDPVLTSKT
ncbi:uncharacterized protein TEOVI_000040700 [Trypanosoma equiperdum]|uniref:Uncharacterized protein n=2 Tax=Trypanozoon TaxID=39700 RepID=Q582K2_TRYB2|nr:hypothetical protein, conserved [Trypanosoma brucei brucei TREU927]AAX78830.1 hypothetical protein, conserved [Trypanosoma brucei]AAZ12651.1 hypothetical protein, conserved [Trypanosoma brucei brucei TREU927]SCU67179.1 hypothetical protein, conserved [Trypanosoma equiperdum]